ncbi:hypothetical protein HPP92_008194 [Vanilla planifolia]|uniref:Uncharacterized protein n=1 Tax=Vanilla planifolia TaxID=51239 RepID=A0A835V9F9_VANPL|nr:hypothetical protein HPP92_008194 [Vanilla planifolia]
MASMDLIREELRKVSEDMESTKEMERYTESTIQLLNSKLLKAKSKLESVASAENRSRGIISNLSTALQQLNTEVETAHTEEKKITEETEKTREEIEMTETNVKSTERNLMGAIQELEAVKASEAVALAKLKNTAESTAQRRALAARCSSAIWVSKWEYEYLTNNAASAQAVAVQKITAIRAWIEVLRAHEKEALLKSEHMEREIKAMKVANTEEEEEEEVYGKGMVPTADKMEDQVDEVMELLKAGMQTPRRSNSMTASRRRSKVQTLSATAGAKTSARSPSLAIQKRKRVIPTLATLLRNRRGRHNK